MKHIISDCVQLGRGMRMMLQDAAHKGNLLTLVQLSRPNWPARIQARAAGFLKSRRLRRLGDFPVICDYLEYLDRELLVYSRQNPVRQEASVADELTLARWEARWARVRQRTQPAESAAAPAAPARTRAVLTKVA